MHGEHVAGSDQEPVAHDRVGITGKRAGVHASHRSGAGIVQRVDLDLSDEHRLFRDTVRGFAEGVVAPVAEELDAHGRFPLAELRQAAELGLLGVPIPEADGGAGGDTLAYALCIEELARIDSSFAITVAAHTSLGTMPILLFGDDAQRAEWLPQLASGERLAAFGLTEPEAGSDAGATRTTARAEDGEWVIDGSKMFITNAGTEISGCVTITARTGDDEISNFIVPERHARLRHRPAAQEDGLEVVRHAPAGVRRLPRSRATTCSGRAARACTSSSRSSTAAASRSPRSGSAWRRAPTSSRSPTRARASSSGARSRASRRSSSSSPTWPPRSRPGAR